MQATQRAGRKGQFQPGWRGRVEGHIRAERSRDCRRRIGRVAVDLPSVGMGEPHRIEEREGFRVTRPMQAILDLQESREIAEEMLIKAFSEARQRGLITELEIKNNQHRLRPILNRTSTVAT